MNPGFAPPVNLKVLLVIGLWVALVWVLGESAVLVAPIVGAIGITTAIRELGESRRAHSQNTFLREILDQLEVGHPKEEAAV